MNKELKIFNNQEFGQVRAVDINGKPYVVASDVAKALGYAIPSKAVNTHCKGVSKMEVPTGGGVQEMLVIPEGDIYRLIMKSKLPAAERFESWVMDEVLPSIRKHGMYAVDELLDNPDLLIETATRLKLEREARLKAEQEVKQLSATVEYKEAIVEGLVANISIAEKQQRINQIVRSSQGNYSERWRLLYAEFDRKHHMDTKTRLNNAISRKEVKKSTSRVAYICNELGMTNELYELACKLFENDKEKLMKEMWTVA